MLCEDRSANVTCQFNKSRWKKTFFQNNIILQSQEPLCRYMGENDTSITAQTVFTLADLLPGFRTEQDWMISTKLA